MNMFLVDFQSRNCEFGLFEVVGTTKNQLNKMLDREIGIYLGGSLAISLICGSILSVIVCRQLDMMNHYITLKLPWIFLLALAALAGLYVRWGNTTLQTESFAPAFRDLPPGFDGCRFVVLGDLHSAFFGEKNETLLETVRAQRPEYIFLVGDLLDAFRDPARRGEAAAALAGMVCLLARKGYRGEEHSHNLSSVAAAAAK